MVDAPERDRRWWRVPLVTLLALIPIAAVDVMVFGLSTMATASCFPDEPCPAADQIANTMVGTFVATLVLWIGTIALPWRMSLRNLRVGLAVVTLVAALWPILWVFVLGGPDA